VILHTSRQNGSNSDEGLAKRFLEDYNKEYGRLFNLYIVADWDYNTNLTEENFQAVVSQLAALLTLLDLFNSSIYPEITLWFLNHAT